METLTELKKAFYEWCAFLSIEEIVSNNKLIRRIERIQKMLLTVEA